MPRRHLLTSIAILYCIRWATGSQCSSRRPILVENGELFLVYDNKNATKSYIWSFGHSALCNGWINGQTEFCRIKYRAL